MDSETLRLTKIAANLQRRWRERYLADLDPDLSAFLTGCPFLTTPETGELGDSFGAAYDAPPAGHRHAQLHAPAAVLDVIAALPDSDALAWLMPTGYHETDGGAFGVPLSWGRLHAAALWLDTERDDFNLVAADGSAGVLITVWIADDLEYNARAWPVL